MNTQGDSNATLEQFDAAWDRLEQRHEVDGSGGAQYTRVVEEWIQAGCPHDCHNFIVAHRLDRIDQADDDGGEAPPLAGDGSEGERS